MKVSQARECSDSWRLFKKSGNQSWRETECGQHYFVGKIIAGRLTEAIRDPSDPDFGAFFLRPIENGSQGGGEDELRSSNEEVLKLCGRCGLIGSNDPQCGHGSTILVVKEDSPLDEERADQVAKCGACGYSAAGRDPVREVIHGTDGPHAVIATTLYQALPKGRKKVLAFADSRQEAAFFAWYLQDSYGDILSRNQLLKVIRNLNAHAQEGLSMRELATGLRDLFRVEAVFSPAAGDLELRREAWRKLYRELLTDEPRISLEGVGCVRWSIAWPKWFNIPKVLMEPPWTLTREEAQCLVLVLLDSIRADRAVEICTEVGISLAWSDLNIQASQMAVRIGPPRRPKGAKNWPIQSWDGNTGKRAGILVKLIERQCGLGEREALEQAVTTLRAVWESIRQDDENASSPHDRLLLPIGDARRLNPIWWRLHPISSADTVFQCSTCGRLQAVSVRGICTRHRCPGTLSEKPLRDLEPNHYRLLYEEDLPGFLRVEEHTAQLDHEKAREFQKEFRGGRIHVLSCSTTFELGVDLGDLDTVFLRNVPPEAFNYAQRVGRAGRRSGTPGFAITYCRRSSHDLYHFSQPDRMLIGNVYPPLLSLHNQKILNRHVVATALSRFFRSFPERFRTVERLSKDLNNPCAVADFKAFLCAHEVELKRTLCAVVPDDMASRLGLEDQSWIENIAGEESGFSLAEAEVANDYQIVRKVEVTSANEGDYDTAKWAKGRAKQISDEDVLSFLSRKAVIPKYGFPVDVVELDTQRTQQSQEAFEVLLQRDLSIAISEFAPTSKLVANKRLWTSYGLKRVTGKEWPRKLYKRCSRHNVFVHWKKGEPEPAGHCGDRLTTYEYIVPRFGFVTDRSKPREPTSRTARVFTTRPYFAGSLHPEGHSTAIPAHSPLVTVAKACPGLMVVLCEGRRGEGFYVCGMCGAGFRSRQKAHKDPYGQTCNGTLEQVSLGHEFVTDVLQLQFYSALEAGPDPVWFTYSLAYAVVEGAAETLEIPSIDLSATVTNRERYSVLPIVLYDNVPGGAGLVARLETEAILNACLHAAQRRVSGGCGCGPDTSCYGCLRNYRNQFCFPPGLDS